MIDIYVKLYYNTYLRQWLVTQIVPSHYPNIKLNMFYSYNRHQQHIKYLLFQVLSMINDYWFIHRIPVSCSGASTYNKLSRIMMLCCCTHSSWIPECDALYDLKRQWYYESVPFQLYQHGIDILILGGDVARRYVHQTFGLEIHAFDCCFWFHYHINCYCIGT